MWQKIKKFFTSWPRKYSIYVYNGDCQLIGEAWCIVSSKSELKENIDVFFLETLRFYDGEDKDYCYYLYQEVR